MRAELDGLLIGYAWAYRPSEDHVGWAYVDDVAVHEAHQSRGVGTAMLDELVRWLHSERITTITGMAMDGRMDQIFHKHGIGIYPADSDPSEDPTPQPE